MFCLDLIGECSCERKPAWYEKMLGLNLIERLLAFCDRSLSDLSYPSSKLFVGGSNWSSSLLSISEYIMLLFWSIFIKLLSI